MTSTKNLNMMTKKRMVSETMPKVLAIIASHESTEQTRLSLESQSIPPVQIAVADEVFHDRNVGIRVARAINSVLEWLDVSEFDWFLRVDGDILLPHDWIEKSVASGADVIGRGGYALLVRMSAFSAVGYRFPVVENEDTMLVLKLQSLGFKAIPYVVKPKFLREPRRGTDRSLLTFFHGGTWAWKSGYEPIHAVYNFISATKIRRNPRYLLGIFGYFFSAFSRVEKWDEGVTRFVRHEQLRRLRRLICD